MEWRPRPVEDLSDENGDAGPAAAPDSLPGPAGGCVASVARRGAASRAALSFSDVLRKLRSNLRRGCGCRGACFASLQSIEFAEAMTDQLLAFFELCKLDQDKVLFDHIRCLKAAHGVPLRYELHQRRVCEKGYMKLLMVGRNRLHAIRQAAVQNKLGPPLDMRYLERSVGADGPRAAEVVSYLQELYESVAEILPEDAAAADVQMLQEDAVVDLVAIDDGDEELDQPAPVGDLEERRYLPPGNITSLWKEHCDMRPESSVSLRTFARVHKDKFANKLRFRKRRQHKVCGTCVRHKLIIRNLGGDYVKRKLQTQYYHLHLRSQRADRGVYYARRALSRLKQICQDGKVHVSLILDGMDQAKFSTPRDERLDQSKEFEGVRPRLHVVGVIVHGYFRQIYVTDPDVPKDSNLTCEILANVLTHLKEMGVPLSVDVVLHIQGDNTCRENKNNTTMKFCGALTGFSRIVVGEQEYLVTGHTHEDIDQLFGRLAKFLLGQHRLEDPAAFVAAINGFMQNLGQTTEMWHRCVKLDHVRNWKQWLSHLSVHVTGIGGPGAPHRFRFERRSDVTGPILTPKRWERASVHAQDVVLTAWNRMCDPTNSPSLPPTLYIPYEELQKLPAGGPAGFAARSPLYQKFKDDLLKMANKIQGAPYHMNAAARWIEGWTAGTLPRERPLSVGYVSEMGSHLQQAHPGHQIVVAEEVDELDVRPNELRFGRGPAQPRAAAGPVQTASARARFVYSTAVHIWKSVHAGEPAAWDGALQQAKIVWDNMPPTAAAVFDVEDQDEDEGEDVLAPLRAA